MPNQLPIDIKQLLSGTTIESNRIEFKEGWNPKTIYRSICAFANDFDNIGGGYIIIGAEEKNGRAIRPVKGLNVDQIDYIQRQILNFNRLLSPEYFPKIYIEDIDNKKIVVLWIPGGSNRPYKVPDDVNAKEKHYNYYIRYNSSSIVPNHEQESELINLCNHIPFDDRANTMASLNDISMVLVRDFLVETKSKLVEQIEHARLSEIMQQMDLVAGPQERLYPKNIALMMFCDHMEKFFPYSKVDIVIYPNGKDNDPSNIQEIPSITGPVHLMIRDTMKYLKNNVISETIVKLPEQAESKKFFNYPYQALEEAVVNALYHRNYQEREPVEISIEPDKITIISYNGPDRSIKTEDFKAGNIRARRYRNRKLGDFLKELDLTEGRATGIPSIKKALKDNGSPTAIFDTNEERSYFLIEIPCHPYFIKSTIVELPEIKFPEIKLPEAHLPTFLTETTHIILKQIEKEPLSKSEIFKRLNISNQTYNKKKFLDPLIDSALIETTVKDKPKSRNQKYKITEKGLQVLTLYKNKQ
ncbi:MAG: putative DNA binding domain-containing protein [Rikenellaceae bacterium]|nr:putative DNA binding domain-containing protein [Rikenellaceae bacterium]